METRDEITHKDAARRITGQMAERDISTEVWPVVKLFTPDGSGTWLLAWVEPDDPDIAWGLALGSQKSEPSA